ncbi:MAG TPA: hypothetical protein VFE32_15135 [Puia sp.]|jgi:hypothetical protein|nr:hypothetical protein [Puia sp.]
MIVLFSLSLSGCSKSASTTTPSFPGNEFLTTVQLQLTNTSDPTDVQLASSTQISPYTHTYQSDSIYNSNAFLHLKANSTYSGKVIILDQTQSPAAVISDEILARENYHLFFFQPSPILASNIIISNTTTNIPQADWLTGQPASDTTAFGISVNELVAATAADALNLTVSRTDEDTNKPPLQVGLNDNFVTGAASQGILRVVLRHQPNAKNGTYDPGSTDFDVTYAVTVY